MHASEPGPQPALCGFHQLSGCGLKPCSCRLSCVASLGSAATETYTCLQLLGELLLERQNVKVMMSYVSDAGNLKLMMTLLKDSSRSIQFEAFHVFKVRDFPGFLP